MSRNTFGEIFTLDVFLRQFCDKKLPIAFFMGFAGYYIDFIKFKLGEVDTCASSRLILEFGPNIFQGLPFASWVFSPETVAGYSKIGTGKKR